MLHKPNLPAFVTTMAWEKRGRGGHYYYRSVRSGNKVYKEYIGTGEFGEAVAQTYETECRIQELEAAKRRKELEQLQELGAPVFELDEEAVTLVRAALVAGGYHRHKGEWRRERSA